MIPKQLKGLRVKRIFPSHAFWGEQVKISVQVENPSRFPIAWLRIDESIAVQLRGSDSLHQVMFLKGQQTAAHQYRINASRRGYYKLGPLRLATSDLFGLSTERVGQVPPEFITVYPRIIALNQLGLPSRLPFGTIVGRQRLFEDPARPMGVRHFRSGDSIRQINWKTSAHTRQLMVKTFQPAISLETVILLNLHLDDYRRKDRYSTIEWAICVAASLAAHLSEQKQPVGLITNGYDPLAFTDAESDFNFDEESGRLLKQNGSTLNKSLDQLLPPPIRTGNGRAHLMKILERLARLESEPTISLPDWTTTACMGLSWGITILAISSKGDIECCQAMHRLVRQGYNPILIVVEPDHNFGVVRQRARRLGFQAFMISAERDMDQWRHPINL